MEIIQFEYHCIIVPLFPSPKCRKLSQKKTLDVEKKSYMYKFPTLPLQRGRVFKLGKFPYFFFETLPEDKIYI